MHKHFGHVGRVAHELYDTATPRWRCKFDGHQNTLEDSTHAVAVIIRMCIKGLNSLKISTSDVSFITCLSIDTTVGCPYIILCNLLRTTSSYSQWIWEKSVTT